MTGGGVRFHADPVRNEANASKPLAGGQRSATTGEAAAKNHPAGMAVSRLRSVSAWPTGFAGAVSALVSRRDFDTFFCVRVFLFDAVAQFFYQPHPLFWK